MFLQLFISFILIVLLLLLCRVGTSKEIHTNPSYETSNLKSGDLVFVSYKNLLGKASKLWNGSKWTHVGMIYKEPITEKLYVIEMAEYNNPNIEKGAIKVSYDVWLKLNKDSEITYKPISKVVDSRKVLSLFQKYKHKQLHRLDYNPKNYKRILFPEKELPNKITCIEFVALLLQELDVLSKQKHSSFYSIVDLSLV
jgi:hypothetical protein